MILYKLTTQDNLTRKGRPEETKWGPNVTHTAKGEGSALCSAAVIHAYTGAALALMMNPLHAQIKKPKLWECEGEIIATDKGRKVGTKTLTTIRELPVPRVEYKHRVFFAILCAKEVYGGKSAVWDAWAEAYLEGTDRTVVSARKARAAVDAAVADATFGAGAACAVASVASVDAANAAYFGAGAAYFAANAAYCAVASVASVDAANAAYFGAGAEYARPSASRETFADLMPKLAEKALTID